MNSRKIVVKTEKLTFGALTVKLTVKQFEGEDRQLFIIDNDNGTAHTFVHGLSEWHEVINDYIDFMDCEADLITYAHEADLWKVEDREALNVVFTDNKNAMIALRNFFGSDGLALAFANAYDGRIGYQTKDR